MDDKSGILVRAALSLEREARLQGYDIELLITHIIDILSKISKETKHD